MKIMNGLDLQSRKITGLAGPLANTDAANKQYVDAAVSGLGGSAAWGGIGGTLANQTDLAAALAAKQAALVSGANIKTLAGQSLLGAGDIAALASLALTTPALTNPAITNYTETLYAPAAGSAFTVDLANGTVQKFTSSANLTVTLPASVAGKSYVVMVAYGGAHTLTWAGGGTRKWAGGTAPTATSVNGKIDIFAFICDGTNTYGSAAGLNF